MPQKPLTEDEEFELLSLERERSVKGNGAPQIAPVPNFGQQAATNAAEYGKGMIGGAFSSLNPIEIGKSLLRPDIAMESQMQQGEEAFRAGKPIQGALRTAAASVPYIGPAAAGLVDTGIKYATGTPREAGEAIGGVLGMVAGGKAISKAVPAAMRYAKNQGPMAEIRGKNMLYDVLAHDPQRATEFGGALERATPHIYANTGGKVKTVADLKSGITNTKARLWGQNVEPMLKFGSEVEVNTSPIADAMRSKIKPSMDPSIAAKIETKAQFYDQPHKVRELEAINQELNASNKNMLSQPGAVEATLRRTNKRGWQFTQHDALRDVLANKIDEITGAPGRFQEFKQLYGDLTEVEGAANKAAESWQHQVRQEKGAVIPGLKTSMRTVRALGWGTPRTAAEMGTQLAEFLSNPDRQVRMAFRRLRQSGNMPKQFMKPTQIKPPTPGQTVPITAGPVPQPKPSSISGGQTPIQVGPVPSPTMNETTLTLSPEEMAATSVAERNLQARYPGSERRRSTIGEIPAPEPRRASDRPIMQKAAALQKAIDDAKTRGDYSTVTKLHDEMMEIWGKNPWITNYLAALRGGP